MTAQIVDTFLFKVDENSLIGMNGGDLALHEQFGMEPEMMHTACYRGFYATYELTEESLYLRALTFREKNANYVPIEGIKPAKEDYQATYDGLSVVAPFMGKIRLAKDFIEELYIHMGYQKPTAFKTVLDITLKEGCVVEIKDRSQEMKQKRRGIQPRHGVGIGLPNKALHRTAISLRPMVRSAKRTYTRREKGMNPCVVTVSSRQGNRLQTFDHADELDRFPKIVGYPGGKHSPALAEASNYRSLTHLKGTSYAP